MCVCLCAGGTGEGRRMQPFSACFETDGSQCKVNKLKENNVRAAMIPMKPVL